METKQKWALTQIADSNDIKCLYVPQEWRPSERNTQSFKFLHEQLQSLKSPSMVRCALQVLRDFEKYPHCLYMVEGIEIMSTIRPPYTLTSHPTIMAAAAATSADTTTTTTSDATATSGVSMNIPSPITTASIIDRAYMHRTPGGKWNVGIQFSSSCKLAVGVLKQKIVDAVASQPKISTSSVIMVVGDMNEEGTSLIEEEEVKVDEKDTASSSASAKVADTKMSYSTSSTSSTSFASSSVSDFGCARVCILAISGMGLVCPASLNDNFPCPPPSYIYLGLDKTTTLVHNIVTALLSTL